MHASGRGQPGMCRPLSKAYGTLGITGASRRRTIKNSVEAAERASRWLWLKMGDQWGSRMPLGHMPRFDQPWSCLLEEGVCCETRIT